jgi:hypothetical protein
MRFKVLLTSVPCLLLAVACSGGSSKATAMPPASTAAPIPSALSLRVVTSNGQMAQNLDDVRCVFFHRVSIFQPGNPVTFTVKNEAGVIVGTGTLSNGAVLSKTPYLCSTSIAVTLDGPAKFVQVEFNDGQHFTGPGGSPLSVTLQ